MTATSMTPEWCLRMAALEGEQEIGAGALDHPLRMPPMTATPLASDAPTDQLREALEEIAALCESGRSYQLATLVLAKARAALSRTTTPSNGGE